MKNFINDTIVITDPCYLEESHSEMEAGTLYGDWSCMVYPGKLEEDTLHQQWNEKYFEFFREFNNPENASRKEEIGKEYDEFIKKWEEEHLLGRFCADAGEVGVFIWDKLSEKDQQFVKNHPWCCTVISDFTGTVEFYDSDSETRHVIGKGNKPFFSVQSGL